MSFRVMFIQNWNNSELTHDKIVCTLIYTNAFPLDYISCSLNLSDDISAGDTFSLSGTLHNDGTYTVDHTVLTGNPVYPFAIYVNEALVPGFTVDATIHLGTYSQAHIIKDTNNVNDRDDVRLYDIKELDSEKFVSEDFFLREPREGTITFKKSDWLVNNFLLSNPAEEINYVLYIDTNGNVIEYIGTDPGYNIGDDINGQIVFSKEVMVQQYSKIIIIIIEFIGNRSIIRFTGLIDKSETGIDTKTITLEVIDFNILIQQFGEQLIKTINAIGSDIDYSWRDSHVLIEEIINKIINMTKLIIPYSNEVSIYNHYLITNISTYWPMSSLVISNEFWGDPPSPGGVWLTNPAFGFPYNPNVTVSTYSQYPMVYRIEYALTSPPNVNIVYYKINIKFIEMNYIVTGGEVQNYEFPNLFNTAEWDLSDAAIYIRGLFFNIYYCSESAYMQSIGEIHFFVRDSLSSPGVYFYAAKQTRYSRIIPFYAESYTYLDIMKTIFLLNDITCYVAGNGTLTFINRKWFQDSSYSWSNPIQIERRDIIKPFGAHAVEKKDIAMPEALSLVWRDEDGILYNNLDNVIKNYFATIFKTKYPLEIECGIRRKRGKDFTLYGGNAGLLPGYCCEIPENVIDNSGVPHIFVIVEIKLVFNKKEGVYVYRIRGYKVTENDT